MFPGNFLLSFLIFFSFLTIRFFATIANFSITIIMVLGEMNTSLSLFFFWLHHAASEILVPQPGSEPSPLALEVWSQPLDFQGSPMNTSFKCLIFL